MKKSREEVRAESKAKVLRLYAPQILPSVPKLLERINEREWETTLDIIHDKHTRTSISSRGRKLKGFIGDFMGFLTTAKLNLTSYGIDELSKVDCGIGLEEVVLNSVQQRTNQFSRGILSNMHEVLIKLYEEDSNQNYSFNRFFCEFADNLEEVYQPHRQRVLDGAKKLVTCRVNNGESTKGNLLLAYSKFAREKIGILGERISGLVNRAISSSSNLDQIVEFLNDKHNYFEEEVDKAAGGLPLSKVHGRLLSYVQALSGKPIKIESSKTSRLSCSFDGETFFLPQVVNLEGDDKGNFRVYKALASYQAGAIMFGTYDKNIKEFLDSFENQEFAKGLFELMEFARLDSRLGQEFPGLRKDLTTFKENYRTKIEKTEEKESILSRIQNYICQEQTDPSILGNIKSIVVPEVSRLREEDSEVDQTIQSTREIYKRLGKLIDLSKQQPLENILNVEEVIFKETRGNVPSYLIATPSKDLAKGNRFRYDEWDSSSGSYKTGFVQVIETPYPDIAENGYVSEVIQSDNLTIKRIREFFDILKPEELVKMKKQHSGNLDYDAWVRALGEQAAGITPSDKIFWKKIRNQRSVSAMILSENSGSLTKFLDLENPDLRLIDVLKRSQIYFSEALNAIGDNFALAAFSGETEQNVKFHILKDFDRPYDLDVKTTVGSMRPLQQNRDGAGIRHATHLLSQQPEKTRFLFYLMEGLPHDFGYEGEHAIEDTKKAIIESKYHNCIPVVVAFGRDINPAIRGLAEHCLYREIKDPKEVPIALPNIYRRIAV